MRKNLRRISALFLLTAITLGVRAQNFTSTYAFGSVTASTGLTDPTPVPTATGVTFGAFHAVGTPVNPNAGGRFSFTNWPGGAISGSNTFTGSINTGQYYEVTISPVAGYTLSLSSISFTMQRSATGVRQYAVRSSLDIYADNVDATINPANANLQVVPTNIFQVADLGSPGAENGSTLDLSGFTNLASPVTFRFYGWNSEGTGGTFSIDNVVVAGSATSTGVAVPTLAVDPSNLTFPVTQINTVSVPQSYLLTAANLTDPIIIGAPPAFQISTAVGGPYSSDLSFSVAEMATPQTVYVRFAPTSAGTFTGDSIAHFTLGAADMRGVYVSGDAIDPSAPTLLIDQSTLSFPATQIGANAASQSYVLTASNLTDNISVTASGPYSVSADNITFTNSFSIPASDPDIATGKTIYVRFTPVSSGSASGSVTNATNGGVSKILSLSGSGLSLISLTTQPYSQNFDGIGSGLPLGISVRTSASLTSIGNGETFNPAPGSWKASGAGFKNFASGNNDEGVAQATATDRAIGLRQTGTFGDPGAAFVFQVANTTGKINFSLDFNLQSLDAASLRTTSWRVDYGFGINPSSFIVPASTGSLITGGGAFFNNAIHVEFGNALDNISGIVTIRIVALNNSAGSGSRASTGIDDFKIVWEDPAGKTMSISTTSLEFAGTAINSSSVATYSILGQTNLDQPIELTATGPFTLSADNNTFSNSISVLPADATNKTIYVKFSPVSVGIFTGTILHASTGAISKTVQLLGESIDPAALAFNFNSCSVSGGPGSGFLSTNITGTQKWACSQYGRNSSTGVDVNGFSAGSAQTNDAWLISPSINLNGIVNIPVLSFYSRGEYSGPGLQLLVSTTYDGTSTPNPADWTPLNGSFPVPPGGPITAWTLSDNIDLSAYKTAPKLYIAFRYTSSSALGAARWSVDDIAITDQSSLITAIPNQFSFPETSVGNNSASQSFTFSAQGSVDITLTPPAGYQLSTDNLTFITSGITIPQATAAGGVPVFIRFSPVAKALKVEGNITATAPGLNKDAVSVTGSSYPKSETLDVACYNISFFGSNSSNNATPAEVDLQVANISTVMQHLNMDVIGIEEMSSDAALVRLVDNLPGYASVVSPRWSYSFDPPDPDFPPQKTGFIYNTSTMTLSATEPPRVMFESLYDSARLNLPGHRLADYPNGTPSSFWASGRLPFMATFTTNISGANEKIRVIVLHAKSGGTADGYIRRQYDAKVLKDSIDALYPTDKVIIVGDYNDRMVTSIYVGNVSPYLPFVNDNADYNILTLPLDQAGRASFPSSTGMIDHITVSNELNAEYINTSIDIEDARLYIPNYTATTASDHLPVFARFSLLGSTLPVSLTDFTARPVNKTVLVKWTTASEQNNSHFLVQRGSDATNFRTIGRVEGAGNSTAAINYEFVDSFPLNGNNYYRLKQVDIDDRSTYSNTVLVRFGSEVPDGLIIYPNPVTNSITLQVKNASSAYKMQLVTVDGRQVMSGLGTVGELSVLLTGHLAELKSGVYILQLNNGKEHYSKKFTKGR